MKILWFTNTPSLYSNKINGYNGEGWVSSLEEEISKLSGVDLAVSFLHKDTIWRVKKGSTTYYPISLYRTVFQKIKHNLLFNKSDISEVAEYLKVIKDFKPDIIHVFGTESSFGLLTFYTTIPVIIHIQGLLNSCYNAWYAPGSNVFDNLRFQNIFDAFKRIKNRNFFKYNSSREVIILANSNYLMGRTEWDKSIVKICSPKAKYFYCGEILRKSFYEANEWKFKKASDIQFISVISKTEYKGFDLVLKTASLLMKILNKNFKWLIFGIDDYDFWERKLKIRVKEVNVKYMGIEDPSGIIREMQNSDMYIHPSYIDNSPNSICEAQYLGMPVISTNVGGISSLITNEIDGMLVPANDPYYLASKIIDLINDHEKAVFMGKNARIKAIDRHNRNKIINQNLAVYEYVKKTESLLNSEFNIS